MSTLERAIEMARQAHVGQVDKGGADYIGHPLRVMEMGRTQRPHSRAVEGVDCYGEEINI